MDAISSPTPRPDRLPHPGPGGVAVTVSVAGTDTEVAVPLGRRSDPSPALAALDAAVGRSDLVVDRTGLAVRGAVVGRDLLVGDRLVPADERRCPAVTGTAGPLRGATVTVDRDLVVGRGGRFGATTIDDAEVSRVHLHLTPTPSALRATDAGSTNGTEHNGRPLSGTVDLLAGDRLTVGTSTLVVVGDPRRGPHLSPGDHTVALRPRAAVAPPTPGATGPGPSTPSAPADRPAMGRWPWLFVGATATAAALATGPGWAAVVTTGTVVALVALGRRRDRRSAPGAAPSPGAGPDRHAAPTPPPEGPDAGEAPSFPRWPGPHLLVAAVAGWSPELWTERPGDEPLVVRVGGAPRHPAGTDDDGDPDRTNPGVTDVDDVPLLVELHRGTTIDVVAPAADLVVDHLAAWLLQLAARHGPDDLELVVLAGPGSPLGDLARSATWLPHVRLGVPGTAPTPAHLVAHLGRPVSGSDRPLVVLADLAAVTDARPADGEPTIDELVRRRGAVLVRGSVAAAPSGPVAPGSPDRVTITASVPPTVVHDGAAGCADLVAPALVDGLARLLAPLTVDRRPDPAAAVTAPLDVRTPAPADVGPAGDDGMRPRP